MKIRKWEKKNLKKPQEIKLFFFWNDRNNLTKITQITWDKMIE